MENLLQINQEQIKSIQLGILKHFINVCKTNGIQYYLAYGSLLGAVRHNGFIPWDDDIDVMIFRSDVSKLIKVFNCGKFRIMNSSIDKKYFSPLLKIYDCSTLLIQEYGQKEGLNLGVYIDVFVLDFVPKEDYERKLFYDKAQKYRFLWSLACKKTTTKSSNVFKWLLRLLLSIPFKMIGANKLARDYDRFASSYNFNEAYGIVVFGEGFEKEYVYTINDLKAIEHQFEDIKASIPISYQRVLTKCYGDYLELPPISERKKHRFNAFYLDDQE